MMLGRTRRPPEGLGGPASLRLHHWAHAVSEVFGATPYLVGSAVHTPKTARDLDVVVILDDDVFDRLIGSPSGD